MIKIIYFIFAKPVLTISLFKLLRAQLDCWKGRYQLQLHVSTYLYCTIHVC